MRFEPRIHRVQSLKAANHQSCANQQNQRQRNFYDHENTAGILATGIGVGTPQSLLQCLIHVRPAQMHRRQDSCNHAGENRNSGGKCEDLHIHADLD